MAGSTTTNRSSFSRASSQACVSGKRSQPTEARLLYQSDWFKKARAYAEGVADRWFILSARHGLVDPSTVIAPYEQTLNSTAATDRRFWAKRVLTSLEPAIDNQTHVIILAGKKYREHLVEPLRNRSVQISRTYPLRYRPRRVSRRSSADCRAARESRSRSGLKPAAVCTDGRTEWKSSTNPMIWWR